MANNTTGFFTWLRGDADENFYGCDSPCEEVPCCGCGRTAEGDPDKKKDKPKAYVNLTDEDVKYMEAVRRGDEAVFGPMIKLAFFRAFPNSIVRDEVWRRDKQRDINKYDIRRKVKSDAGWLGEGVYFYGAKEVAEAAYEYGWNLRPFFINIERAYVMDRPTHDAIARANAQGVSKAVTEVTNDFDGVFYNGDMNEEWCVRSPCQMKFAGVSYDDQGRIIPLSYRFKADNPDIRF